MVEEAAVQYEGDEGSQSALTGWSRGFGSVGVHLAKS